MQKQCLICQGQIRCTQNRTWTLHKVFNFFFNTPALLVGHWYPSFELLVCLPLPSISKPGWILCLHTLKTCVKWIPQIHLWCDTHWLLMTSMAAEPFWSIYLHTCTQTLVGHFTGPCNGLPYSFTLSTTKCSLPMRSHTIGMRCEITAAHWLWSRDNLMGVKDSSLVYVFSHDKREYYGFS